MEEIYEKAKLALEKYYELFGRIDKLPVADALEELKSVSEDLVEVITDFTYPE